MNKSVRQKTWRWKRTAIKTSVHAQGSGTVLDCECVRARVSVKSQQEAAAGSIPGKENRPENDKQLKNNSFSGDNPQSDASLFHICALLFRSRRPSVCWVLSDSCLSSLFLLFLHTDAAFPSPSLSIRPSAALSLQRETKLRQIRSRVSASCFQNKLSAINPNWQKVKKMLFEWTHLYLSEWNGPVLNIITVCHLFEI